MLTVVWRTPICKPRYFWTIFTTLQTYHLTTLQLSTSIRYTMDTLSYCSGERYRTAELATRDILSTLTGILQTFLYVYMLFKIA